MLASLRASKKAAARSRFGRLGLPILLDESEVTVARFVPFEGGVRMPVGLANGFPEPGFGAIPVTQLVVVPADVALDVVVLGIECGRFLEVRLRFLGTVQPM